MNTPNAAEFVMTMVENNPAFASMIAACKSPEEMAQKACLAFAMMSARGDFNK